MNLDPSRFEGKHNGKETGLYFLRNANGIEIAITNYGARLVGLTVPGRNEEVDVVTGFDSLQGYLEAREQYHGAIVGRYANRIAHGRFTLEGRTYQLDINNPPNHLHGGLEGLHRQVWNVQEQSPARIALAHFSPDGESHYPGNVQFRVVYECVGDGGLSISYSAETDAPTFINLTSHPFFNLNGQGTSTIDKHLLQILASNYTPVDKSLIPTGISTVAGTPFDFRQPAAIGEHIGDKNEQLVYGAGYDHNFVIDGQGLRLAARATGDLSGIAMEVLTDQPGMQLYSGNYLRGDHRIKYGLTDEYRMAFCLETQHYPDSPNQPDFPSTLLEPDRPFHSQTIYRFIPGH